MTPLPRSTEKSCSQQNIQHTNNYKQPSTHMMNNNTQRAAVGKNQIALKVREALRDVIIPFVFSSVAHTHPLSLTYITGCLQSYRRWDCQSWKGETAEDG